MLRLRPAVGRAARRFRRLTLIETGSELSASG